MGLSLRSSEAPLPPPAEDAAAAALEHAGTLQTIELGVWDAALSLTSAFAVNSAIVIVAGAALHGSVASGAVGLDEAASLGGAHALLAPALGGASSALFAAALLASGQSSTFTGTMAGQVVMEGFLHLRLAPWLRRLATRGLAIGPAALVAVLAGDAGLNQLLVASQVVLSLQLPFAMVPLVAFASSRERLGPYAVGRGVAGVGWAVCAAVLALNAFMLVQVLGPLAG